MKPTVIGTIDKVLDIVPDGEPFKIELKALRDSIFMELPESNRVWWVAASSIFLKHFPVDSGSYLEWHYTAEKIWIASQRANQ